MLTPPQQVVPIFGWTSYLRFKVPTLYMPITISVVDAAQGNRVIDNTAAAFARAVVVRTSGGAPAATTGFVHQGGTYRLKLADIPGRPGLTLYPTLTLAAGDARAAGFLRHSAIGLELTGEDFDEAAAGRLITRTVSLPDGTILAVLRMGNLDLESGFPDR